MTQTLRDHAIAALRTYRDRGESALDLLRHDVNHVDFWHLMRKRDAAFANFRALDAKALAAGVDIGDDEEARLINESICTVNAQLDRLMEATKLRVANENNHFAKSIRILDRYRVNRQEVP